MKKLLFITLLCFTLLFLTNFKSIDNSINVSNMPIKTSYSEYNTLNFILNNMSNSKLGIYTNYLDSKDINIDKATGKDILSESQGLLLLYFLNKDDKPNFDKALKFTIKNLSLKNSTFSWRIRELEFKDNSNCLVNDLRILKALILADEKWDDKYYSKKIKKVSEGLLKYNTKNDICFDFYDTKNKTNSKYNTISHIDLYTLKKLSSLDKRWEKIYESSKNIVLNSQIPNTSFYQYRYNISNKKYINQKNIDLTQNLYTLIHLAEVDLVSLKDVNWIYEEFKKNNKLYSHYSFDLSPESNIESTAIYSLASRLFYLIDEPEKSKELLNKCNDFKVSSKDSPLYGSFANEQTEEVYSFDNLQYLLSISLLDI
ncbi:glycosyl hydrolase family 8 [Tepidibacter hydrothermalis]|uniref:Glycosyl hydrolase family 8 n=1 Tax=Tepidibacter hydrothermalis TaxID=3036126 RepID=A0ABY8EDP4_9FIRM|nr:glycosyl hydrolase family 8 [Tepidibacter hydrothermalis]WFD11060.1 glycosyl hydrolase family 8 [Tepidibacter hydrothermalis]